MFFGSFCRLLVSVLYFDSVSYPNQRLLNEWIQVSCHVQVVQMEGSNPWVGRVAIQIFHPIQQGHRIAPVFYLVYSETKQNTSQLGGMGRTRLCMSSTLVALQRPDSQSINFGEAPWLDTFQLKLTVRTITTRGVSQRSWSCLFRDVLRLCFGTTRVAKRMQVSHVLSPPPMESTKSSTAHKPTSSDFQRGY